MMDIAGIDYSTHYVDIVRIPEAGTPVWDRFQLVGSDSFDRARTVAATFPGDAATYWDDVLAVGIEEPAGRNTGHLFRIQGAILSQIPSRMLVEKWMPSAWRKAVGLPGNCSKIDVHYHAWSEVHWVDPWPQDAADAYCIALATKHALERQAA